MNEAANHWKIGLFVLASSTLLAIAIVYLGSWSLRNETVTYTSYFDESVTGLDMGSPVRFRGVNIGKVAEIDIAPDQRQIEVTYELDVSLLAGLGLAQLDGQQTRLLIPPELRAQIGSAGVTGVKYVLIDFLDVKSNPPPELRFPVPDNYIPSAPSTLKSLEDSVVRAVDQFPKLTGELSLILTHVNAILVEVESQQLSTKAATTLANIDRTLASLDATLAMSRAKLSGVDTEGLSHEAKTAMNSVHATMERAQSLMLRIEGDNGMLDSVQRATDAIGDVAGDARGYGAELSATLQDLSEAAHAVRQLVDALELDSDMLFKGRAKVGQ